MKITGGCYCGEVRYEADGPARFKGQCHCRECQYITGGGPNLFLIVGADTFKYVKGEPQRFARTDLESPVTREFCPKCGTHLVTKPQRDPSMVIVKAGTLDDPAQYGGPQVAIWMADAQPWHTVPEGVPQLPGFPG